MAQPGPRVWVQGELNGHVSLNLFREQVVLSDYDARDLADAIYDFFGLSRVTIPQPKREDRGDPPLIVRRSDIDPVLNYANQVASVMKLHGFTFDQAMLIVGVVMDKDE